MFAVERLFEKRQVSVIILNWNKYDQTRRTVESVLKYTSPEVEIILVDNGSDPDVVEQLSEYFSETRVVFLKIGVNRYFGEGNNIGAEAAGGDTLVFLNNDVLVTENWLEPLILELENNPTVGAVGPKFLYPDGVLQEAGAFLDQDGHSVQRGKGLASGASQFNDRSEVHYVSAACIALRKSDFFMVGGFNFIYEPAYYEDTDLCFSIRAAGLSVIYQPKSTVFHLESQTTGSSAARPLVEGVVETNRSKFLHRWGGGRVPAQLKISEVAEVLCPQQASLTVVVFTPFDLVFGGGEKYILNVALAFFQSGYRTIVATPHRYSKNRLDALGAHFGMDLRGIEIKCLSEVGSSVDVFVTMGNEFYPPVKPIGKFNIHHCQFPFPDKSKTTEKVSRLNDIDVVVVNSEFTRRNCIESIRNAGFKDIRVVVVSPPVSDLAVPQNPRRPQQIISVGRFFTGGHTKNQHILIEAFRSVVRDYPESTLVLAGGLASGSKNRAYLNRCLELAEGLPVSFHIDVDSDEIQALISTSSLYWHAAGFGVDTDSNPELCEHFGITLVEAMGAGVIPIVVGNGGPDEIVDFGVSGFKFQSIDGLLRRTGLVFDLDPQDQQAMRANARRRFEEYQLPNFSGKWNSLFGEELNVIASRGQP